MAISNYLQKCDYRLGGLKPFIYLIHKNALKLNFKAKGVEVSFKKTKEGDIYKINGAMVVYNQEETYQSKYRFNNILEVTINEQYREPFFYGLRTLRTNEYYIIIEDKKSVQYLINPELYTNLNYEYNFSDTANVQNAVLLTWNNLSNYPLLIMEERVDTDILLLGEECPYNLGQAFSLIMTQHKDLKTKDDGVKATDIYIDDVEKLKRIEYLKESFTLNETYDGDKFRVTLSYSIPLDDNQFEWHYNLLEFENNRYTAVLRTTNDNYIICGIENGLFPKYNIQTSEDDETPNMINITFEQLSQYPIIFTDDITQYRWIDDEQICFGYDKYQMLVQQQSLDWGETWIMTDPLVKKKGDLVEKDSDDCKKYQWVDDGTYCKEITTEYVQYRETSSFVCENGNKYEKLQKYTSTDGKTYSPQDEYIKGDLIEENSDSCNYVAIRWVDVTDGYMCYEVNEDLTEWREVPDTFGCIDYGSYKVEKEYITNNGTIYYESGEERYGDLVKMNDYNCGWRQVLGFYDFDNTYCTTAITDTSVETHSFIGFGSNLSDDTYNYGACTIKGQGTYTLNIQVPSIYNDYSDDLYIFASRLDEDVIYTATTSTSSSVGNTNYNKCVFYKKNKYGNWTYTVNDDDEHTIQFGYLIKNVKNISIGYTFYITRALQPNTMYRKVEMGEVTNVIDGNFIYDTLFNMYLPIEYNSCDCGYVGYDWICGDENGYEYICGSELVKTYNISITQSENDYYQYEITNGNTIEEINNSTSYINSSSKYINLNLTNTTIGGEYILKVTSSGKTTGTTSHISSSSSNGVEVISSGYSYNGSDYNVHYTIFKTTELNPTIYTKVPGYNIPSTGGTAYVKLTIEPNYDSTSMYEVWREYEKCSNDYTGNIEYRNPQKSYDCGWVTYQWREDEDNVCGNALPSNTTEVSEAPQLNTDFE